jgi:hypothetical protein
MKRNVSVVRLIVATRSSGPPASGKIIKEMLSSVASGTPLLYTVEKFQSESVLGYCELQQANDGLMKSVFLKKHRRSKTVHRTSTVVQSNTDVFLFDSCIFGSKVDHHQAIKKEGKNVMCIILSYMGVCGIPQIYPFF